MRTVQKGKGPATSDSHNYDSGNESDDLPQLQRKRSRTEADSTSKKTASKKNAPRKTTSKKTTTKNTSTKPTKGGTSKSKKTTEAATIAARLERLEGMKFKQTKWADERTLSALGITGDVTEIFNNMGLGGFFQMACPSHEEETYQFISSFRFEDDSSLEIEDENRGIIHFKIHDEAYSMPVAQLNTIFHVPHGGTLYNPKFDWDESLAVWGDIAHGTNSKGSSKSASIRNPAVRYAHIFLANTLFARRETGNVREEELLLLVEGIKNRLVHSTSGRAIVGQTGRIHFGHYLARRFLEFQDWVMTNKDSTPEISFGGLITPILEALDIPFTKEAPPIIARIDVSYLVNKHYLAGQVGGSPAYHFSMGNDKYSMLLPKNIATSIANRDNIIFEPRVFYLYNLDRDGPIQRLSSRITTYHQADEEEEDPVIGSHRYEFQKFSGPVPGDALKNAHVNMHMLHRFIKWQNKSIKKMAKRFKEQKKQIKGLKLRCLRLERQLSIDATSSQPTTPTQQDDVEESSNTLRRAPISPTSSGSGNPSYSIGSSYNEE